MLLLVGLVLTVLGGTGLAILARISWNRPVGDDCAIVLLGSMSVFMLTLGMVITTAALGVVVYCLLLAFGFLGGYVTGTWRR